LEVKGKRVSYILYIYIAPAKIFGLSSTVGIMTLHRFAPVKILGLLSTACIMALHRFALAMILRLMGTICMVPRHRCNLHGVTLGFYTDELWHSPEGFRFFR